MNLSDEGMMNNDKLKIAGREFRSRLMVGTGKYGSLEQMAQALEASGAEVVTVAVRRVNVSDRNKESLLDSIDSKKFFILPNTAGCYSVDEAVRTARLAREVGLSNWVKLEVIGDEKTLFPDNVGLLKATEILAKEGFVVLPYTNDDIVTARRLIDAGAAAVMPLGAPIGSGMGIQNLTNIRILREMIQDVPFDRRCRSRDGFRCDHRHGTGGRWHSHEYWDCAGARSCGHGRGDELWDAGG